VTRDPRSNDARRFRWVLAVTFAVYAGVGAGIYVAEVPPRPEWVNARLRAAQLLVQPSAEELRKQAEEEARKKAEEEARKKAEAEALRKAEEEARKKAAEEAKRRAEEEARRKAEEEARKQAEEEARKQAEAAARQKAEEEARKRAEEEARRRAEEEARKQAEAAARQKADEEARKQAEIDARRRAEEEARRQVEAEARRQAEEAARLKAEAEARRLAEEEARRQAAAELARRQAEAEARRLAEAEARRQAAEEARRQAAAEVARQQAEAEARRLAEEEARKQAEEAARLARIRAALEEKHRREEQARQDQEAAMSAGLMGDLGAPEEDLGGFLPESKAPLVGSPEGNLLGGSAPPPPEEPAPTGPAVGSGSGIGTAEMADVDALLANIEDLQGVEALLGDRVADQAASREEILAFLDDVAKGRVSGRMVARDTTVVESPFRIEGEIGGVGIRKAEEIATIIRSHRGELADLYSKALVVRPGFAGLVTVRMIIAADGSVREATVISSTTGYTGFDEALVRRVRTWRFPTVRSGEVTGTYPFRFTEAL